jgi:hypothetical protein
VALEALAFSSVSAEVVGWASFCGKLLGSDEFCMEIAMAKMALVKGVRLVEGIWVAFQTD